MKSESLSRLLHSRYTLASHASHARALHLIGLEIERLPTNWVVISSGESGGLTLPTVSAFLLAAALESVPQLFSFQQKLGQATAARGFQHEMDELSGTGRERENFFCFFVTDM